MQTYTYKQIQSLWRKPRHTKYPALAQRIVAFDLDDIERIVVDGCIRKIAGSNYLRVLVYQDDTLKAELVFVSIETEFRIMERELIGRRLSKVA